MYQGIIQFRIPGQINNAVVADADAGDVGCDEGEGLVIIMQKILLDWCLAYIGTYHAATLSFP